MTPASTTTTVLLDTTVIIDVLRNRNQRRAWLEQLILSGKSLAISAVTIAEVYAGMRPGEEIQTKAQLANFDWIPVTGSIAEHAGLLRSSNARTGTTHSLMDLIIAATAMDRAIPLVTDNQRHFQLQDLMLLPLP